MEGQKPPDRKELADPRGYRPFWIKAFDKTSSLRDGRSGALNPWKTLLLMYISCFVNLKDKTWKDRSGKKHPVRRGQMVTSYRKLSEGDGRIQPGLGWGKKKIEGWSRALSMDNSIEVSTVSGTQALLVTLIDPERYWLSGSQSSVDSFDGTSDGKNETVSTEFRPTVDTLRSSPRDLKSEKEPEKSKPRAESSSEGGENQESLRNVSGTESRLSSQRRDFDESSASRTDHYFSMGEKPGAQDGQGTGKAGKDPPTVLPICPNLGCERRKLKQAVIPLKDGSGWFCPENKGGCGAHYESRLWKQKGRQLIDLDEVWQESKAREEKEFRDRADRLIQEHPEQFEEGRKAYLNLLQSVTEPLKKKATDHGLGNRT